MKDFLALPIRLVDKAWILDSCQDGWLQQFPELLKTLQQDQKSLYSHVHCNFYTSDMEKVFPISGEQLWIDDFLLKVKNFKKEL